MATPIAGFEPEGVEIIPGLQDNLLITFGGVGENFGWRRKARLSGAAAICLRDSRSRWYLDGCDGHESYHQTLEYLKGVVRSISPRRLTCLGQSAGGYAAIRFGFNLGADTIVAFAPQTRFFPWRPEADENALYPPQDLVDIRDVERLGKSELHTFRSVSEAGNPKSAFFWNDVKHCEIVEDLPRSYLHLVNCDYHGLARRLIDLDILDPIISEAVGGGLSAWLDKHPGALMA